MSINLQFLAAIIDGRISWNSAKAIYRTLTFVLIGVLLASACGIKSSQVELSNCHVVSHAMGETCVPFYPQRVVIWGGTELDPVLALGVKPIAGTPHILTYVKDKLNKDKWEGIEEIGSAEGPNLERLLALKPDLILGHESRIRQAYERLSQIAPTVLSGADDRHWKQTLMLFAEALGKTDVAEQLLGDYQARIEKFKAQIGDRLPKTFAIVETRPDTLLVYPQETFPVGVLEDAGLSLSPALAKYDARTWNISKESLRDVDADAIFVLAWEGSQKGRQEAQSELDKLKADPLWSQLNAVRQDKVYEVGDYFQGAGPLTANLILDDLFKYLVEQPQS